MRYRIEPAKYEDIEAIGKIVRDADRAELWAAAMQEPESVMRRGIKLSDYALTGFADDKPVCMYGVVTTSFIGNSGTPWMVATKYLDDYALPFLRRCRGPVMVMLQEYDILQNYVDARNVRAIEWLKWLGFKVTPEPKPYGLLGLPFHKFEMENSHV